MVDKKSWFPTEKNIEDFKLLREMLSSQRSEYNLLSKKKADSQLNTMKIKILNRVLEPIREIFEHEESYQFLDTLSEDDLPTNSDVVLILSQFETAIERFTGKYYRKDPYDLNQYGRHIERWMTQEYPPDFNAEED